MSTKALTRRELLWSATAATAAAQSASRPNVLFVVVDDLDCRIRSYGDPLAITPNLDRLASRGVRFERAYCQYPLCNPTRSSVLSGRYPTSTRVFDNNTYLMLDGAQQTMPEYFAANGYEVQQFGKIFHGPNKGLRRNATKPPDPTGRTGAVNWFTPEERARQQAADPGYWNNTHSPYRNMRPPNPADYAWANEYGPLPESDPGIDAPIADKALGAMRQMAGGAKPFFLAVGFQRPHVPLTAPKKYFDLFSPDQMRLPPDFDTEPRAIENFPRDEFRQNLDLFAARPFTVAEARAAMRAYYACVTYMDDQLGRLLDELDRLRAAENTIVVLWGDHGWHLSEKGMWAKGTLFEVSARGPMIIADPRRSGKGRPSPAVVQYLDLYPTLVDLCGLPPAAWLEGTSLKPLLENPKAAWNRPAYTVQTREWFLGKSVRTERWRYTEWDEGRRGAALFDHDHDPHEMKNLAQDPRHAGTVRQLKGLLGKLA